MERTKNSTITPRILLALVSLITLAGACSIRYWSKAETGSSFAVYYTAATLVRSHMNLDVYDGIKPGVNPQLEVADPATAFACTAKAHGIPHVMLYLYPPTFADLMVPLTFFSPAVAFIVWDILNVVMLLVTSFLLTRMLDIRAPVWASLVAVFLIFFRPTLNSFYFGQVSILLLLLLVAGVSLYARGSRNMAALLFALAAAIKLTPLIVIVPFLAWRDWKILRAITLWCVGILGALWIANGSAALGFYFRNVLTSMSGDNLGSSNYSDGNRTLGAIFYQFLHGPDPNTTSTALVWGVRLLSVAVLCYAGWLSEVRKGEKVSDTQRLGIISMFLLLSCCVSPFSWLYAWVLCLPALVFLGKKIAEGRSTGVEATLAVLFLLSLITSKLHFGLLTPPFGVALGLIALHNLPLSESVKEPSLSRLSIFLLHRENVGLAGGLQSPRRTALARRSCVQSSVWRISIQEASTWRKA